jgi:hypothetical protein
MFTAEMSCVGEMCVRMSSAVCTGLAHMYRDIPIEI